MESAALQRRRIWLHSLAEGHVANIVLPGRSDMFRGVVTRIEAQSEELRVRYGARAQIHRFSRSSGLSLDHERAASGQP